MEIEQGSPAAIYGLKDLVDAWHSFRIQIIAAFLLYGLFTSWVLLRRRCHGQRQPTPPLPGSPGQLTASDPKRQWPAEEVGMIPGRKKEISESHGNSFVLAGTRFAESPPRLGPKRVTGSRPRKKPTYLGETLREECGRPFLRLRVQPLVFFSSLTGSTENAARNFRVKLGEHLLPTTGSQSAYFLEPQIHDLSYIDYDDFFILPPNQKAPTSELRYFYLLLLPTYDIDTALNNFIFHLQETHHDFRIDSAPLSTLLGYSVFGFGDREGWASEKQGFCSQAREVDKWMAKLTGGKRAYPLGMGDVKSDAAKKIEEWGLGVKEMLWSVVQNNGSLGEGVQGSGDAVESDEDDDAEVEDIRPKSNMMAQGKRKRNPADNVGDLEDLGEKTPSTATSHKSSLASNPLVVDFTTSSRSRSFTAASPLEMVPLTSPTHASLTKQGYSIIGSHSGVKLCRWTKSALRGRGSCYKFSFYGIASHLCMETTPSLSCSNKCVFCWRHGTNPVGTQWRWKVDPPDLIFNGVKEAHYRKIKAMKGVPGVRAERFQQAMRIRHCALSLVGEPIFYPHINEFTALLHAEHISSFLVCNAQHPVQLEALKPVTQLYVSIDASNRESLKRIDRPLHRDFWERFQACLRILREKRWTQRTVFRLTLVKGFNVEEEVEGYADLVEKGLPCFVEIKGVTYCGTSESKGAGLTMQNVPFWEEVEAFVVALDRALGRRGLEYGIAAEHRHSCCALLASKRFLIEGVWHTLIDYGRFFDCLESGREFRPEDYVGEPTPEWALWGNGGFNPADERVHRKGKNKDPIQSSVVET